MANVLLACLPMWWRLPILATLWSVVAVASLGQEIRVRVIDAKTGKPVKDMRVRVELVEGTPMHSRPGYLELKTDANGSASFDLASRDPKLVSIGFGGHWMQCSPTIYKVEEIVKAGVVIESECANLKKIDQQFARTPGEVIIFAKHWYFLNPDVHFPL